MIEPNSQRADGGAPLAVPNRAPRAPMLDTPTPDSPILAPRTSQVAARFRAATLALAALALAGCASFGLPGSAPTPTPGTSEAVTPPPEPRNVTPPSGANETSLRQFYANVEDDLIASGRMRLDTAPPDAPYSVDDLIRDFERVALYDEYVDVGGRFVRSETPAPLRRWSEPIRVGVMSSASMPPVEAAQDRGNVAAFTRRLARLTDTDMKMSDGPDVNFLVLFVGGGDPDTFADEVSARYPSFAPAVTRALRGKPLDIFCVTNAFRSTEDASIYSAVLIMIRAEHPPLTRLSCVHEEMGQAMGLPNDSPDARPSIFNGGLEFALLTEHDEILLRMLYDPRLRPGMTAAEVRPLLPAIARDAIAAERADGARVALAEN